jgi:O-antigen/teichoic acid export membrane protein
MPIGVVDHVRSGIVRIRARALQESELQNLWRLGVHSGLSMIDQGLTSGSSFLLNVLLARWLLKEAYGAFAMAFIGFLFVAGFHNVLVLEPISVMGSSRHLNCLSAYFLMQLKAHAMVTGALSVICLSVAGLLAFQHLAGFAGEAILGAAISLPFLLLLGLTRRMCYVAQCPALAAKAGLLNVSMILCGAGGLHYLGWLNPLSAFLLLGVASFLASAAILSGLGLLEAGEKRMAAPRLQSVLSENWSYGRWLTLTTVLSWLSVQAQAFFVGSDLGLGEAGVMRAMQLPSLAMTQVISAATLLMLPSLSRELGDRNFLRLHKKTVFASMILSALGCLFVVLLGLYSGQTERLLFGGKYASSAWLMPALGLASVFTGFATSYSYALRTLGKARFELLAYLLSAIAAVVTAAVLMPRWGLPGAAASVVFSSGVLMASVFFCYLKWGRFAPLPHPSVSAAD